MNPSVNNSYLSVQIGPRVINFYLRGRVNQWQEISGTEQEVRLQQTGAGWECWLEAKAGGRIRSVEFFVRLKNKEKPEFSSCSVAEVFSPEPNHAARHYYKGSERVKIDFNYHPEYWGGDGYFTPALFFFALRFDRDWLGVGVGATRDEFQFLSYEYQGQRNGFRLALNYEPLSYEVRQGWRSPRIFILGGPDEWELMEKYIAYLSKNYIRLPQKENYEWWQGPLFCGWGEQCYRAKRQGVEPHVLATQEQYEEFSQIIDELGFKPSAIIIDDKWQQHYADFKEDKNKWPDLSGYVDRQHKKGRRVLLWIPLWRNEGLEREECILTNQGEPLCPDPTAKKYQARIEYGIEYLLSQKGINADGFKIDFSGAFYPREEMCWAKNLWGTELLRQYMAEIYKAAKAVKNDALVITQTPNPCFWEITDMLRLNDMPTGLDSIIEPMEMRARIAKIACPGFLIDTDNWPIPSKREWLRYARKQREWGVVSLYYLTGIDTTGEKITVADWEKLLAILNQKD